MAMFVTGITERVELDGGEWIDIRKLSAKQLDDARRARERAAGETARAFGGDVFAALQHARNDLEAREDVAAASADVLNGFDRWSVLRAGIVAWSDSRRVNVSSIEDLDEETSVEVARRILALSIPERDEETRKNS